MTSEGEKRKLADFRVVDLRAELEKRGLESKGVKATLLERLQKVLRDEGHDPEEYTFEPETPKTTPKRPSMKRGEQDAESETQSNADENHEGMEVEDEGKEKEDEEEDKIENGKGAEGDKKPIKEELKIEPLSKDNAAKDTSIEVKVEAVKEEANDGIKEVKQEPVEAEKPEANGVDNEDSINLTIGEDEEKLLADEEDSSSLDKEAKEKKPKPVPVTGTSRNLWVSGLSSSTRATDLKQVFSKYGKVIGAKVVTNARTPGARCYGYVTMATSEDASKCIQHIHRTELHGRMISVERAKGDSAGPPKKGADGRIIGAKKVEEKKKHEKKPGPSSTKSDEKKDEKADGSKSEGEAGKEGEKKSGEGKKERASGEGPDKAGSGTEKEGERPDKVRSREVSRERRERHRSAGSSSHQSHPSRPVSRSPRRVLKPSPIRRPGVLTFTQIKEERERQRLRERERELREEDRRRREEMARQREIEKRQREEAIRLEREKERLRVERERIEEERAELMRLERERQRLEREKLEREREELKRQQMSIICSRFEEARRGTKRPSDDRREPYEGERKRVVTDRRYEGSQTSRFEEGARSNEFQGKKDYKQDFAGRHGNSGKFEGSNYDQDNRTARGEGLVIKKDTSHELPRRDHTVQDVGRGKDGRFERGPTFRVRDDRRPDNDHRPKVDMRHSGRERYPEPTKEGGRYTDRSGESWHAGGGPPPVKPFGSMSSGGPPSRDSWGPGERKSDGQNWGRPMDSGSSERWVSTGGGPMGVVGRSGPGMGGPSMYAGQPNAPPNPPGMNMGMSSGGPYGSDRFDSYKQSMGPLRKY